MYLHPFRPPHTYRQVWDSSEARTTWDERIRRAGRAAAALEILTVAEGLRPAGIIHIAATSLIAQMSMLARMGLIARDLKWVRRFEGFAHSHEQASPMAPDALAYVVIARTPDVIDSFAEADARSDHAAIGRLLGYPDCCVAAFCERWSGGYIDPVWQAATATPGTQVAATSDGRIPTHTADVASWDPLVSPIGRYISLRLSFHIACRFDCPASASMARAYLDLARHDGGADTAWWRDALSGATWDALNGVAIVRYPAMGLRLVMNSVPCWPRYVVRLCP